MSLVQTYQLRERYWGVKRKQMSAYWFWSEYLKFRLLDTKDFVVSSSPNYSIGNDGISSVKTIQSSQRSGDYQTVLIVGMTNPTVKARRFIRKMELDVAERAKEYLESGPDAQAIYAMTFIGIRARVWVLKRVHMKGVPRATIKMIPTFGSYSLGDWGSYVDAKSDASWYISTVVAELKGKIGPEMPKSLGLKGKDYLSNIDTEKRSVPGLFAITGVHQVRLNPPF